MMSQSFEIKSSAFPYDMASWCKEKMSTVVCGLARMAETVSHENTSETDRAIIGNLSHTLYNATKMLAFSCGADWEPSDRDLIVEKGTLGHEELQVKYGLIREDPGQERVFEPTKFISECRDLLAGERAQNRTLMHDLLCRARFREPLLLVLEEELEKVTMGKLEWSDFVPHALDILAQIEEANTERPET